MNDYQTNPFRLPLTEFFQTLRENGFVIGVEHYLDTQRVVRGLWPGAESPPPADNPMPDLARLRSLLCPLLATDPEQQELFYRLFDRHFGLAPPPPEPDRPKMPEAPPLPRWRYNLAVIAVLLILTVALLAAPTWLEWRDDLRRSEQQITEIKARIADRQARVQELTRPIPEPVEPTGRSLPVIRVAYETTTPISQPNRLTITIPPASWLVRNALALKLLWAGIILTIVIARELYRRNTKLALQRLTKKKAGGVWSIAIEETTEIAVERDFYDIANRLRQRVPAKSYRLNMPATVQATIRRGGALSLKFTRRTRPPEYLVLIDYAGQQNHQVSLFRFIARKLTQTDIHVETFYYDGSPRVCWNSKYPSGLPLEQLAHHYPDHRLLLFGPGQQLISPVTGELSDWTKDFSQWSERAILTSRPANFWDYTELELAKLFHVLPASLNGLAEVVDHFEQVRLTELRQWIFEPERQDFSLVLSDDPAQAVALLQRFLTKNEFEWLAAGVMYPELFWDLTLFIGRTIAPPNENRLTRETLHKFSRIPWFVRGAMPEDFRDYILRERFDILPEETRVKVAAAIVELLKKNRPEKDTRADYRWHMNIAVYEYLAIRDAKSRKKHLKQIQNLQDANTPADRVMLNYLLDQDRRLTDFLLPDFFKKFFRKQRLEWGPGLRLALAGLLAMLPVLLWRPQLPTPTCDPPNLQLEAVARTEEQAAAQFSLAADAPGGVTAQLELTDPAGRVTGEKTRRLTDGLAEPVELEFVYPTGRENIATRLIVTLLEAGFRDTIELTILPARAAIEQLTVWPDTLRLNDRARGQPFRDSLVVANYGQRPLELNLAAEADWLTAMNPDSIRLQPAQRDTIILGGRLDYPPGTEIMAGLQLSAGNATDRMILAADVYGPLEPPVVDSTVIVPDVTGQDLAGARSILQQRRLTTGTVREEETDRLGPGRVLHQTPPAGTAVSPGSAVILTLAKAVPDSIIVPDLIGATKDDALVVLNKNRLQLGFITSIETGTQEPGRIVEQSPAAGQKVTEGAAVDIITAKAVTTNQYTDPKTNITFVRVPEGSFEIGSDEGDSDEKDGKTVNVKEFWLGQTEVTNAQYAQFLNDKKAPADSVEKWIHLDGSYSNEKCRISKSGSSFVVEKGYENHPVIYVTWYGAKAFCDHYGYRLPTEPEWEYAATWKDADKDGRRDKDNARFGNGQDIARASEMNFNASAAYKESYSEVGEYRARTVTANSLARNALGLYHMSGNVWEWCADNWHDSYTELKADGKWDSVGNTQRRVLRGGSWSDLPILARAANRSYSNPAYRDYDVGFRVVRGF